VSEQPPTEYAPPGWFADPTGLQAPALVGRDTMGSADAPRTEVVAAAPPGNDRARQPGRADHRHRGDRQH